MKIVFFFLLIAFLSSSFDIFLMIPAGGSNIRICQVALILLILAAGGAMLQRHVVLWPRGGSMLLLWTALQGILIARSVIPLLSLELYLLLLVPILGVFAVLQLYGRSTWLRWLMKGYLVSFVCVAIFGIFQFVAPVLHLGAPLVRQWTLYGVLPRVNGFSYEPSYYATYLVMGWIALLDLRLSKAAIVSSRTWLVMTWIVSIALFLSTSKTAWAFMIVEGVLRFSSTAMGFVRHAWRRLRAGYLVFPRLRFATVAAIATVILAWGVSIASVSRLVDLNVFLSGSGINGAASHSVDQRYLDFSWTWQVVQEHPFLGLGLGGVDGRIGELKGTPVQNAEDFRLNWGFPVPVEVLAASGVFGFIPILWFFVEITWGERKLIRENPTDQRALWLKALIRALCFEWLFLSADQNIERMYLWLHVAVLVTVAYHLRFTARHSPASVHFIPVESAA